MMGFGTMSEVEKSYKIRDEWHGGKSRADYAMSSMHMCQLSVWRFVEMVVVVRC